MKLMEEIAKEIEKKNIPKWNILKNNAEEEIIKMIDSGIPITKQIDLLLKHNVVEKLDRKEYTEIIKKHFGYKTSSKKNSKSKIKSIEIPVIKKSVNQTKERIKKKSSVDKLSEDVDLMSTYLKKKADK